MSQMSDYLEGQIRAHIFRSATFTKPTALYIALCTAAPTDASTGSTIVEPGTGGYARQQLDPNDSNWTAASGTDGLTDNASAISWTAGSGGFGTLTHVAICSASSAGNMYLYGSLDAPRVVSENDVFNFPIGALNITFA